MQAFNKLLYDLAFFQQQTIISVEEITTGLSQQSFKVQCLNNQFFYAKYFDKNNAKYAQIEKEVLINSASSVITFPLLYSDQHWLITPFIQANDLSDSTTTIKQKIYLALDLMLEFQEVEINSKHIKSISFVSHANFYIKSLRFNEEQQQILRLFLNDDYGFPEHQVLCHGDLNFTNMLFDIQHIDQLLSANTHVKLIDFECCCYAEVEYDIAMMIAGNNLLNHTDVESIINDIKQYLLATNVNISRQKITRYLFKSLLLNALWYMCRFEQAKDKKWGYLAKQQFQQADLLSNNQVSIAESLKLYLPE